MGSVSISVAPIPPKEFSKKKKSNRLAKLKQSKLDVRRQQWLSQVNAKEFKTESNDKGRSPPTVFGPIQCNKTMERNNRQTSPDRDEDRDDENLKYTLCSTNHDASDYKVSSSPPQLTSSSSSNGSRGSSSYWSINLSEEDEEDEDCLDDWEAMADALPPLKDKKLGPTENPLSENDARVTSPVALQTPSSHSVTETTKITYKPSIILQAWSANDVLRPQSLPIFSNKISISKDSEFNSSRGNIIQACHNTLCPICCEDLDLTDSSFQPCTCGFRLCLFCHNRILDEDSRCPGCRKKYNC
ncbi:unnamed protein product [Rhodiola kirilowii]